MAKRLIMEITYIERGAVSYPISPKIQLGFERSYNVAIGSLDSGNMTKAYELAWYVQMQHKEDMPGGLMPGMDEWIGQIEAVETKSEDIVAFPLGRQDDGSQNSRSLAGLLHTSS